MGPGAALMANGWHIVSTDSLLDMLHAVADGEDPDAVMLEALANGEADDESEGA